MPSTSHKSTKEDFNKETHALGYSTTKCIL